MKKKRKNLLVCVNGVKGAISLFLAVLMTPFLTIAMLLVETGRYNSAVSILDELLGVSSISTLANYDSFVKDRWGLMALPQEKPLKDVYNGYLSQNSEIMGDSLKINKLEANGMYPLSDRDVLMNQLMEFCKLNAPTELVNNFGNLSTIIDTLEGFTNYGSIVNLLTSGVDIADAAITVGKSAGKLMESANKLDQLTEEYASKYSAFESGVNDIINALRRIVSLQESEAQLSSQLADLTFELDNLPSGEEYDKRRTELEDEIDDVKSLQSAAQSERESLENSIPNKRRRASNAQKEYAKVIKDIADELGNYKDLMHESVEALTNIGDKFADGLNTALTLEAGLKEKKDSMDNLSNQIQTMEANGTAQSNPEAYQDLLKKKADMSEAIANIELKSSIGKAAGTGFKQITDGWQTTMDDYSEDVILQIKKGFEDLRQVVLSVDISAIDTWSEYITQAKYKTVAVSGYVKAEDIDAYLKEQEDEVKSGSLGDLLDGLGSVYEQVMGLSILYVDNLNSVIDSDYYDSALGGLPADANAGGAIGNVLENLSLTAKSIIKLKVNFFTFRWLELWENVKNLLQGLIGTIQGIYNVFAMIIKALIGLFNYETWWTCTYCAYNLPCRTDFVKGNGGFGAMSFTAMTGASVTDQSLNETVKFPSVPVFSEIGGMISTMNSMKNKTGSDYAFSGAELEYIMFGSDSEMANQIYVFFVMYIIRAVCCAIQISANAEVQALAASTTLGYPVVMGIYYIFEPLVQTILLVNGSVQQLMPTTIYLAPSGVPALLKELVFFCKLSETKSKNITAKLENAFVKAEEMDEYKAKLDKAKKPAEMPKDKTLLSDLKKSYKKSLLSFSYRDYCFITMLFLVTKEERESRLMNLIQMETLNYYKNQKATFTFDLKKAYTFIDADVNATVVQMLPSLLDTSLFTVDREHYRGY